jgi:putative transposase
VEGPAEGRLRVRGVRTSKHRVLRLMRESDPLAPSRVCAPRGPRSHDGTLVPETLDTIWGTDLTTIITGEDQAAVFIAVDHFIAECFGIHAARHATRFEALEPIRQGVRQHFRGFAKDIARGLAVRHDHGSQYMSDAFQGELRFLGTRVRPHSSAPPRAMAVPNASFARRRRTCCGYVASRRSRTCVSRC